MEPSLISLTFNVVKIPGLRAEWALCWNDSSVLILMLVGQFHISSGPQADRGEEVRVMLNHCHTEKFFLWFVLILLLLVYSICLKKVLKAVWGQGEGGGRERQQEILQRWWEGKGDIQLFLWPLEFKPLDFLLKVTRKWQAQGLTIEKWVFVKITQKLKNKHKN